MTSQAFLWMNTGIALALAGLFFFGRWRERDPVRLRLRSGNKWAHGLVLREEARMAPQPTHLRPSTHGGSFAPKMKSLNVIFNYNGHSWDAYEVLGVPAGAKLEAVKAAYLDAIGKSDPQSREFLETAFQTISQNL